MDNLRTNNSAAANFEVRNFLIGLGLEVDETVVFQVLRVLQNREELSLYDLYKHGKKIDGTKRTPICGKGTVNKIKKLFETGSLDPILDDQLAERKASQGVTQPTDYEISRSDEKAVASIREHLVAFLSKVQEILPKLPMTKIPFPEDEVLNLLSCMDNYVLENLGNTHLVRFRTDAGIQIPPAMFLHEKNILLWNTLQCRAAPLVELINETKAAGRAYQW